MQNQYTNQQIVASWTYWIVEKGSLADNLMGFVVNTKMYEKIIRN